MSEQAPPDPIPRDMAALQVTVEVRAIDSGPTPERAWRLSRAVSPLEIQFGGHLPFEEKRPIACELLLPDDEELLLLTGVVVRGDKYDRVRFAKLDELQTQRLHVYTQTRRAEVFR